MKIAVPYENGQAFQNFGHSAQFKIQDTENGKILSSEIVSTNAANATFRNQIGVWRSSLSAFHLLTHGSQPHFSNIPLDRHSKPNRHLETHAVPYATSGSFLRTPSAVVSYKTRPANLARTSQLRVPSELFHLPSSSSFNTSCPAQTSGNQYPSASASS